jgi:adenylosuccinate synthase
MGWFDAVATRYGCMLQGATEAALTNLDVLGFLDKIPVCSAYEIDGKTTKQFPVSARISLAKPVLEEMPGWKEDISHIRKFEELPRLAQNYVLHIERMIGVPIRWISVGPNREELIERERH